MTLASTCRHEEARVHSDLHDGDSLFCNDCCTILTRELKPGYSECLNFRDDFWSCGGRVAFNSIDPGRTEAFPRCDVHWAKRLKDREGSIEMYENSDSPPDWFDPMDAGEVWGPDDY